MKGLLGHFASRYIAGETIDEALAVVRDLNSAGLKATVDNLGENVTGRAHANAAVKEYYRLLARIKTEKLDATVSLKLTHMGLDISEELAMKNTSRVVARAAKLKNFVRIDMESSQYCAMTVEAASLIHAALSNVGVAIQTYLLRSRADCKRLTEEGISIRLVKGAYKEPPRIALATKAEVDKNYSWLMRKMLRDNTNVAIATHDRKLIEEAKAYVKKKKIKKETFEFQMLYGIKRALQKELAQEGYNVRVYVPYGPDWIPYILRRMTERKENLWFVIKHIFEK